MRVLIVESEVNLGWLWKNHLERFFPTVRLARGQSEAVALIEREAAGNLKRTWVNYDRARNWMGPEGEGRTFLSQAIEIKTVWVPYGE